MHERFEKRIEEGLESLGRRLDKAKKKPNRSQVERQIGRLLGKNSRAAGLFDVKVSEVDRNGVSGFLEVRSESSTASSPMMLCCLLQTDARFESDA